MRELSYVTASFLHQIEHVLLRLLRARNLHKKNLAAGCCKSLWQTWKFLVKVSCTSVICISVTKCVLMMCSEPPLKKIKQTVLSFGVAEFWSIYCKTCTSEYSKWLPLVVLFTKFVFGRRPKPRWGSLQCFPRPPSRFKVDSTSKGYQSINQSISQFLSWPK